MLTDIRAAAEEDPLGAVIVALLVVLIALMTAAMIEQQVRVWSGDRHTPYVPIPPPPIPLPPRDWREKAKSGDVFEAKGLTIHYWGNPAARYGISATNKADAFEGIVAHYTEDRPAVAMVQYQHEGDRSRGGSYGYHFYVDKFGRIFQGAPLSARTNHIKPPGAHSRTKKGSRLANENAIGVSMVGGCYRNPGKRAITASCDGERLTDAQYASGLTLIKALQERYDIPRSSVWGHGDLQTDRSEFEGSTLSAKIRNGRGAE